MSTWSIYINRCKEKTMQMKIVDVIKKHLVKNGLVMVAEIEEKNDAAGSSVHWMEALRKKGVEVLYMADPMDENCARQLKRFDGKNMSPGDDWEAT